MFIHYFVLAPKVPTFEEYLAVKTQKGEERSSFFKGKKLAKNTDVKVISQYIWPGGDVTRCVITLTETLYISSVCHICY